MAVVRREDLQCLMKNKRKLGNFRSYSRTEDITSIMSIEDKYVVLSRRFDHRSRNLLRTSLAKFLAAVFQNHDSQKN